jgi:phosphohistidine phosphatase
MPKHLVLIRHAKAKKAPLISATLADTERPLTKRGRRDARAMGRLLAKRGFHPDLIWASPARRSLDTARLLARQLGYRRKDILVDGRLYATSAVRLLQLIRDLKRNLSRVVLCGHNPELHSAANRLGAAVDSLPTSALVQLTFDARDWSTVASATLVRVRFDRPNRD